MSIYRVFASLLARSLSFNTRLNFLDFCLISFLVQSHGEHGEREVKRTEALQRAPTFATCCMPLVTAASSRHEREV